MARMINNDQALGVVVAVSISDRKGMPKSNVPAIQLVTDWGIKDDAHAGLGLRQVSLLAIESIAKLQSLGLDVGPGAFAENITTSHLDLPALQPGDRLVIGEAEVEITQIGKECHSRCAIYQAAGDCVMPREGIFGRVLRGGVVRPGDKITLFRVAKECQSGVSPGASPSLLAEDSA